MRILIVFLLMLMTSVMVLNVERGCSVDQDISLGTKVVIIAGDYKGKEGTIVGRACSFDKRSYTQRYANIFTIKTSDGEVNLFKRDFYIIED